MASARIQRWALTLSAYDCTTSYKPGAENANADLFSRRPLPETTAEVPLPGETIFLLENLTTSLVTVSQIRTVTSRDPMLSRACLIVSLLGYLHNVVRKLSCCACVAVEGVLLLWVEFAKWLIDIVDHLFIFREPWSAVHVKLQQYDETFTSVYSPAHVVAQSKATESLQSFGSCGQWHTTGITYLWAALRSKLIVSQKRQQSYP